MKTGKAMTLIEAFLDASNGQITMKSFTRADCSRVRTSEERSSRISSGCCPIDFASSTAAVSNKRPRSTLARSEPSAMLPPPLAFVEKTFSR